MAEPGHYFDPGLILALGRAGGAGAADPVGLGYQGHAPAELDGRVAGGMQVRSAGGAARAVGQGHEERNRSCGRRGPVQQRRPLAGADFDSKQRAHLVRRSAAS